MLERGGNAVDAAVATALAIGVVEPWMSGLGGTGFMVVQPASGESPVVVNYGPIAPRAARPDLFEVVGGPSGGLFPWPMVKDDANQQGWRSPVVPGTARGLGLALERFGRLNLATVVEPARRLAADGFPANWYLTLRVALDAATIARYPETARTFLPGGFPLTPASSGELPPRLVVQPDLAETLERLARFGVDDVYTGETSRRIIAGMQANGGLIDAEDLAGYQARVEPAVTVDYHGWRVGTPGGPTGGTTLAQMLRGFAADPASTTPFGSVDYADGLLRAFSAAFAARYLELGDPEPLGTSTTHLAVADNDGMVVSCTQTLPTVFGSRVTVPGTGFLLNDGMYWFDPEPGRPNSAGPAKRPLCNMTPLVATGPGGWPRLAVGSSGGRRIVSANAQFVLGTVDGGLPLGEVLDAPRLDASGEHVLADVRVAPELLAGLRERGWTVLAVEESPYPKHFASPAGVLAHKDGTRQGAADKQMPTGVAAC
jgi:gamma-glutamyltranspeptidase/glutathione hydrolase